ncbi:MAG: FAD-binding protein [Verrucomicrobiaceae bacterium]|nr:MAG: FAD-binding protein [Verrucomicrobiaceae bacterium]
MQSIDVLIAGAGFSGLVVAQRLSEAGLKCVILERRGHLGGNAYDKPDKNGVLYHCYGPHYFRTNSKAVRDYLSRFTEWHPADYRVKSRTHGKYWSFPVNLATFEQLTGRPATEEEFIAWLETERVPCAHPANSEEVILASAGRTFYELFFQGYTLKQWARHPRELDASVCSRIPIRTIRDDHYLREEFQALPAEGFTRLFERMSEASPGLEIHLNTDFLTERHRWQPRHTVFTGPVDAYFNHAHGHLPYRSLRFEVEALSADDLRTQKREAVSGSPGHWQPALQVNYPNDEEFTRIVEIKHATGQQTPHTNIVREYPLPADAAHEPYYPIPAPDTRAQYEKYRTAAAQEKNTSFIGRLATYHYFNMDQVVALAMKEADRLLPMLLPAPVAVPCAE